MVLALLVGRLWRGQCKRRKPANGPANASGNVVLCGDSLCCFVVVSFVELFVVVFEIGKNKKKDEAKAAKKSTCISSQNTKYKIQITRQKRCETTKKMTNMMRRRRCKNEKEEGETPRVRATQAEREDVVYGTGGTHK